MKQAVCRRLFRSCKPNDTERTGSIMADNQSQEMYLETLLRIQKRGVNVRAVDVAAELGYSKPSVSRAVGIMKKNGYIVVRSDGVIELTEPGRAKAESVLSRHEVLTKAFEKVGLAFESAEENACKVEHVITQEAFDAIKKHFDL